MAKQKSTMPPTGVVTEPLFKYGDRVRILHSSNQQGRIVELRGPLGPGGVQIYRLRIKGRFKRTYTEVREDQIVLITGESDKKTDNGKPKKKSPGKIQTVPTPSTTAANAVPSIADYIVKTPEVCSGQPHIAGTRVKVKHVYTWVERMGRSPVQVVAEYPYLTMAQVHAALAYYWSHEKEIQQDIENEDNRIAELKSQAPPSKNSKG